MKTSVVSWPTLTHTHANLNLGSASKRKYAVIVFLSLPLLPTQWFQFHSLSCRCQVSDFFLTTVKLKRRAQVPRHITPALSYPSILRLVGRQVSGASVIHCQGWISRTSRIALPCTCCHPFCAEEHRELCIQETEISLGGKKPTLPTRPDTMFSALQMVHKPCCSRTRRFAITQF